MQPCGPDLCCFHLSTFLSVDSLASSLGDVHYTRQRVAFHFSLLTHHANVYLLLRPMAIVLITSRRPRLATFITVMSWPELLASRQSHYLVCPSTRLHDPNLNAEQIWPQRRSRTPRQPARKLSAKPLVMFPKRLQAADRHPVTDYRP